MAADVIIIGGGIAGLACGVELSRSGLSVTVLESSHELGGRARSWTDTKTGDRVDIGPHILLTEYHNMLQFMGDLGTRDNICWQSGTFITFVDEPHPVDIKMSRLPAPFHFLPSLLAVPQVSFRDLLTNYRILWRVIKLNDSDIHRLDDIKAEDYLREKGVSENFIDWFWRSACMSIMNLPLESCSAGALFSFFRYMIGKSGYQVGFPRTGLGDLFVPGAVQQIQESGGEVRTGVKVSTIEGKGKASAVQLSDGRRLQADAIVSAVPAQQLYELLPPRWKLLPAFSSLPKFKPSPYISVYLWFDRKLSEKRFWARVWAPDNLNYDFYDLSNIRAGCAQNPSLIASNIVYSHRAKHMSDAEIINRTLYELKDYLPQATQRSLQHAAVHRIPMAVPASFPGVQQMRLATESPVEGLWLAGDWTATGLPFSMESAVRSGYLAAEKILHQRGCPRRIAIPPPSTEGLVRVIGGR